MEKLLRTYKISPEIAYKFQLLKLSSRKTMSQLLELMIEREWEEKRDSIARKIPPQQANKQAKKLLEKLRIK